MRRNDEIYTITLLEKLRGEAGKLWGSASDFYFRVDKLLNQLAAPDLHDIPLDLPYRIEMWDAANIRFVVSANRSVALAHAAFDAAIKAHPDQRWTLRQGILVIREHKP
jgi:hypothetical protein